MINRFTRYLLLALLLIAVILSLVPIESVLAADVTVNVSVITPTITTSSATSIVGSGATLQGTLNSLGG